MIFWGRRLLTVSQVKHRVSLVNTPSNSLWTKVASCGDVPELELGVAVTMVGEERVPTELDTLINQLQSHIRAFCIVLLTVIS